MQRESIRETSDHLQRFYGWRELMNGKLEFSDTECMLNHRYRVVPAGDQVSFHCLAKGATPITYIWNMNGKRLLSRKTDSNLEADKLTLLLKNVVKFPVHQVESDTEHQHT